MPVPDFAPGEVLTAAAMDSIGLWLVKTQTVGTGVSTVTVSDVFSANYDNYRIIISGGTASSAGNNCLFQFGGITTNVYSAAGYFVTYGTATVSAYAPAAGATWLVGFWGQDSTSISMDVINPQKAKHKGMNTLSSMQFNYSFTGQCASTTVATGFTLTPAAGTITGQTIRVYGYRN
jgi:hypothetical protein